MCSSNVSHHFKVLNISDFDFSLNQIKTKQVKMNIIYCAHGYTPVEVFRICIQQTICGFSLSNIVSLHQTPEFAQRRMSIG